MKGKRLTADLWVVISLIMGILPGCATDLVAFQKRLEPHYRTYRPEGNGPFPAVMLVSGCSGISSTIVPTFYLRTAERFKGQGYVVIFVDYLSARGLQSACGSGVSADEIAQDILASASYLRSLPFVKASEISVIGWSLGGGGVLASLASIREEKPALFHAAVVFYPGCRGIPPWKVKIPVLMLLGALDDVTPPGPCQELAKRVPPENPVEVRVYSEARHSFVASDLPLVMAFPGRPDRTLGYNPQAAAAAWEEVDRFLRR